MKHQPYRDWLLSEQPLAADEAAAVEAHLAECGACRQFQTAWAHVRDQLERSPVLSAPRGFGARVTARLARERRRRQGRQAWAALALALIGSVGVMVGLLWASLNNLPAGASGLLKSALIFQSQVSALWAALQGLAETMPTPDARWLGVSLLVAAAGLAITVNASLGAIWAAAVFRFGNPRSQLEG